MATFVKVLLPLLLAMISTATLSVIVHAGANPPPMFVFGDIYLDVGNNNNLSAGDIRADHPYYGIDFPGGVATGRFTNGYGFIDFFAQYMGFKQSPRGFLSRPLTDDDIYKGMNFASAGSGILVKCVEGGVVKCLSMEMQIDYFKQVKSFTESKLGVEAANQLISKSIFIFVCGTTDLNDFGISSVYSFNFFDVFALNLTSAFKVQLKELYDQGARKFAILNVPGIGLFPTSWILDFLKIVGLDVQGILNKFAGIFNEAMALVVKELSSTLPGMKYSIGNSYAIHHDMVANAKKIGFKDVKNPCCGEVRYVPTPPFFKVTKCTTTASLCSNRSEYFFFDHLSPTEAVTKYASDLFYYGDLTVSSPMNIKELVEYESLGESVEAM